MRRLPTRPDNEISQQYNSGVVKIFREENTAPAGYQPRPTQILVATLRYEEQRLGINRLYLSRQNQIEIERVIRIPRRPDITNQNTAVTEDGRQYRIDTVQSVEDVWPKSLDISLTKVEQEATP